MRRPANLALLAALAFLAASPAAQAALNGSHGIAMGLDYGAGVRAEGANFTFFSGRLEADLPGVRGPVGVFASQGVQVTGVTQVCVSPYLPSDCRSDGPFTITVASGGSFGLALPAPASLAVAADHALGFFVDFSADRDLNSLQLQKTLVASAVGGTVAFPPLAIPVTPAATGIDPDRCAKLTGLDDGTRVTVAKGAQVVSDRTGKDDPVLFQGPAAAVSTARGERLVVPFEAGSRAVWTPATSDDARAGLDLGRLDATIADLNEAGKDSSGSGGPSFSNLTSLEPVLARVLNGALLSLPAEAGSGGEVVRALDLVRADELAVTSDGSRLRLAGRGPLDIQDGEVLHAEPLYGFLVFQLPWWSWVLWVLALGAFATRVALKSPRMHPRWDRYRWVGWVAGPLCMLLLVVLWDLETRAVLGASALDILSGTLAGDVALLIGALEFVPLLLMLFAVASPIRLLLKSLLRIFGQGSFLNLSGAAAYLLSYLLGAHLLLSYLGLALRQAAGA